MDLEYLNSEILKNYINGKWVDSTTDETRDVINPASGEVLAKTPICTKEEALETIKAAKEAFWKWRTTPAQSRIRYLYDFRDALEENFDDLVEVVTKEHGKTLDESRGEYRRAIENVEAATHIPSLQMGYNFEEIASGIDEMVIKQPLGVFFCVAPFNFPVMVPAWFWPYAIATGNTYIVKPSDQCPISMVKQFEILDEIGLPKGVVNLLHGGPEVVNALVESPDTVGLSFVGSTKVGKLLYKKCGEVGKRVQVQGGAKNFITIMPDANIDRTVPNLITSFFGNAGQRCLAGGVLLTVGDVHNPLKEKLIESTKQIKVGDGMDEDNHMGPLASEAGMKKVLEYIEKGIDEGATLVLDGRNVRDDESLKNGFYVGPTIFENVSPEMSIAQEEIFGPVMPIVNVKNLDEAIEVIHNNPYGNASSIFTSSGKSARDYQYLVKAGNIGINIGVAAPIATFPFSGMKDSFMGDLHGQGKSGIDFFTEDKVVITRWFD